MPLTATGMRIVMRQLAEIEDQPIDGLRLIPCDDLSALQFELDGPEGTPYADGRFRVALVLDEEYPQVPPRGYFRQKIFHPNVADGSGDICVNALKKDWTPTLGLRHVLLVIRCLLVEPNPESALNEEAGRLLLEDYADYERKARMLTQIHAKRPVSCTTHASGNSNRDYNVTREDKAKVPFQSSLNSVDTERIAAHIHPGQPGYSPSLIDTTTPAPSAEGATLRDLSGNKTPLKQEDGTAGAARFSADRNGDPHARAGISGESSVDATERAKKRAAEKKKAALRRI